jgi:RNA polymerase sigma factor (sigma-70 family)
MVNNYPHPSMVYVVDDDPSIRRAIRRLLRGIGLETELFGSAKEFLSHSRPNVPSCIILDVRLPGISGLDLQHTLIASGIHIPVIFITSHGHISMAVRAMKAGAVDFLQKPVRDQDLFDAVKAALHSDQVRREREEEIAILRQRLADLTVREQEMLPLVVSGMPNKAIAAVIGMSVQTVKVHRSRLTRKMCAKSVVQLIGMAEKLEIAGLKEKSRQ